jgi:DNA-binding transcriptional LysR family regulator
VPSCTSGPDGPVHEPNLEQVALWRYEMVFVVVLDDPAARGEYADVEVLAARPFSFYQRAVVIEEAIRQFCLEAGFAPKVVMHND